MIRLLLTGAGGSAAYNFRDALKLTNEDYYIVGTDTKPYHLEMIDADKKYVIPPVTSPAYLPTINKLIKAEQIDFLHPQPDVEVAYLSKHVKKIKTKTFLPAADEVELCHDKMRFNQVLTAARVPVPKALHIQNKSNLSKTLAHLLKSESKVWLRAIHGAGSKASLPVSNFYQADAWINYWQNHRGLTYSDFMVSEFLPGREFAWQSVWFNGSLVTSQARERIEYIFGSLTPSGQTSSPSVAKTVNRKDVNNTAVAAVKAVSKKPHGVYCVDMKEDVDGVPKVTEINIGRFFTTSNFFAHAGLNMPAMYIELGMSGKLKHKPKQLNPLPADLYWVRMIDMGFKLIEGETWTSTEL